MKELFKKVVHFFYSMRTQFLFVILLVGLVPLFAIGNIIINVYNDQIINARIDELKSYGTMISNLITTSDYLSKGADESVDTEVREIAEIYNGRILVVDDNLKIIKDTYELEKDKVVISSEVVKCFYDSESIYKNDLGNYIQITMPIVDSDLLIVKGVLIMSFSKSNINLISEKVTDNIRTLEAVLVILIVALALLYSVFTTLPLKKISKSIDEITNGNMDVKLEEKGFSEIQIISKSFNSMIDVINDQEESRQEFVSNVSHELKTPLASVKVLSDSLLTQEDAPVEFYREFMGDINEEIERMTDIVNDLLSMVRLEKNSSKMIITNLSINDLIEKILKRLRPIASKRKIDLIYESFRPVMADVDEVKISIAINNLIENAIKYNYDDGWVKVSLNADHRYFFITVQDCGVGIPEDLQDKVFDRFYRVDKARSRATGGTGLGLSITRKIILLHNGTIRVYSKEKEGSTFTVRIPLNYSSPDSNFSEKAEESESTGEL
ncbi:MAG: HAMP domain-containing histidine kinase [Lachnospiraceae bacterium]|nr:HAMP domain-containing histidine kinase [Lachnospiraceae bacterium]